MLSYRHAFHAGNHADVLKHYCLFTVARYFAGKNKPLSYIDTHAGSGVYELNSPQAAQNKEYNQGILKLLPVSAAVPVSLAAFLDFTGNFTACGLYPGSATVAAAVLAAKTPLSLFELHPRDYQDLRQNFAGLKTARLYHADGLTGLIALLPPVARRAVILLDPAYERRDDYRQVVSTLQAALSRFATGCYLLWYPCLMRPESLDLPRRLQKLNPRWLRAELYVKNPAPVGMYGSGMWIINPPYTLAAELRQTLPFLARWLGQDASCGFLLTEGQGNK